MRELGGGISYKAGSMNVYFYEFVFCTLFTSLLSSFVLGPIECLRASYYGNLTFPKEVRRDYKSIPDALLKII